jgi:hypothetical protein
VELPFPVVILEEFGEHLVLGHVGDVVKASKGSQADWNLHPCLSEQDIAATSCFLEWASLVGGKGSNSGVEQDLVSLHSMIIVDLLRIGSIVTIVYLDHLDLLFSISWIIKNMLEIIRNNLCLVTY